MFILCYNLATLTLLRLFKMSFKTQSEIDLMPKDLRDGYLASQGLDPSGNRSASRGPTPELEGFHFVILGLVLLAILIYNLYFASNKFFFDMRENFPLFFYTNPMWVLLFIFFAQKSKIATVISAAFLTLSIPIYTVVTSFVFVYFFGKSIDFSTYSQTLFQSAFGDYGRELSHFSLLSDYARDGDGLWSFKYLNGLVLICSMPFLFLLYRRIGSFIHKKTVNFDWDDLKWEAFLEIILVGFLYFCSQYIIDFAQTQSTTLGYVATWSILLFPFLGLRMAIDNSRIDFFKKKSNIIFTLYYIVFFTGFVVYIAYNDLSWLKFNNKEDFMMFVPLLSVCYLVQSLDYYRPKKQSNKKATTSKKASKITGAFKKIFLTFFAIIAFFLIDGLL